MTTDERFNVLGRIDEGPDGVTLTYVCGRCRRELGGQMFLPQKTTAEARDGGFPVFNVPSGITCGCGVHYPDTTIPLHAT